MAKGQNPAPAPTLKPAPPINNPNAGKVTVIVTGPVEVRPEGSNIVVEKRGA